MSEETPTRADIAMAVDGRLARLEAEVRLKGWEVAAGAGRWDQAFLRLRGLADLYRANDAQQAWTRLLLAGLVAAARSNARGEVGRFVRATAPNAHRLGPGRMRAIFETCAERRQDALAEEIGAALAREWPDAPIGWFAKADAAERHATRKDWRPAESWAEDFRVALERGGALEASWRQHIAVRWITAHLRANGSRGVVRDTLKQLAINELPEQDAIWLAFGLGHSDHWLDRVKACDILDDRLDERGARGLAAGQRLLDAVGALFEHLPPMPNSVVMERLKGLVEHPVLSSVSGAWIEALERRKTATNPHLPLVDFSAATGPAAELRRALAGEFDSLDERFVADLCASIVDPTEANVETVRRRLVTTPPPLWRAVAVAWPTWLSAELPTDLLDRFGKAWCARSPAPSYGWWELANHFEQAKTWDAARAAAWRGIQSGEDHDVRDLVLGKVLTRVVREADLATLERWLVACERIASSS